MGQPLRHRLGVGLYAMAGRRLYGDGRHRLRHLGDTDGQLEPGGGIYRAAVGGARGLLRYRRLCHGYPHLECRLRSAPHRGHPDLWLALLRRSARQYGAGRSGGLGGWRGLQPLQRRHIRARFLWVRHHRVQRLPELARPYQGRIWYSRHTQAGDCRVGVRRRSGIPVADPGIPRVGHAGGLVHSDLILSGEC